MIPTRTPAFSSRLTPTNDRPPLRLCPLLLEDCWVFSDLATRHGASVEGDCASGQGWNGCTFSLPSMRADQSASYKRFFSGIRIF